MTTDILEGPAPLADRRRFVLGASAALLCAGARLAGAAPAAPPPDYSGPLPAEPEADVLPGLGTGRPGRRRVMVGGTRRPSDAEAAVAARVVTAAPTATLLDVMRYVEALKTLNRDGESYNAGLKTRWNPVIVDFFRATGTRPSGDTTSWCAASLNWTLARCGYAGGTSSGSFRNAPGQTRHPRPGDIVVFGEADPAAFARGQSHVALFLAEKADRVLVLGGNQKNVAGHQAVCRKWLDKRDGERRLHSYHAIRALRSAA